MDGGMYGWTDDGQMNRWVSGWMDALLMDTWVGELLSEWVGEGVNA